MDKMKEVFSPFMRTVRINEWKWFIADTLVALIYVITVVGYIYQHWSRVKFSWWVTSSRCWDL